MRRATLAPLLWCTTTAAAHAAPPPLVPVEQGELTADKPEGFKHLFAEEDASFTASEGLFTTLRIQWFPVDTALAINHEQAHQLEVEGLVEFADTLAEQAPIGGFSYGEAQDRDDGPGRVMQMHYSLLGYGMTVGMYLHVDRGRARIVTAFLFTSDERYEALGGLDLVTAVADSLRRLDDPRPPDPEWYWPGVIPEALARPPEDADALTTAASP